MRNIRLFQKAIMRKRIRYNRVHKHLRILRSSRRKTKTIRYKDTSQYQNSLPLVPFVAPESFSMANDTESVINFINTVYRTIQEKNNHCRVFFDVENVERTDNGAIGVLLALINALSQKHIHAYGNSPRNPESNDVFVNSGFFEHVKLLQGKKSNTIDSFIVQKGRDKTNSQMVGREVRKIIKYLTHEEKTYKPLYTLIGEMISNSIEHANRISADKNWLLSIHYEREKVVIMVIDIGKGIMATLRKKIKQKLNDTIHFRSSVDTLVNLFKGEYQSSTFEDNRNKGLPFIKECFDNNYINSLFVITNNVFLDFNNVLSREMVTNFRGTFYSWEVTRKNIEIWRNRKI